MYLCKLRTKDVPFTMASEEVCETQWVSRDMVRQWVEHKQRVEKCSFSPWFMKMFQNGLLDKWWEMAASNQLRNVAAEEKLAVTSL